MKKKDVEIKGTYLVKVSGKKVPVRIDAPHMNGGWAGTNLVTNRKVRIKTGGRLRTPLSKSVANALVKEKKATKIMAKNIRGIMIGG